MERILHQLIGSLSHYLQGFVHPRWLFGISEPSTVWFMKTGFSILLKLWAQLKISCLRSQKVGKGTSAHVGKPHSPRESNCESSPRHQQSLTVTTNFQTMPFQSWKTLNRSLLSAILFSFWSCRFQCNCQENYALQNQSNTPSKPNIVPENQWDWKMLHFLLK